MPTFEERLSAIETRLTAAPPAVSVDTLLERVKLGDAAKIELFRTLRPWETEHRKGRTSRFSRRAVAGRNEYQVYVPEGVIGETRYHLSADLYTSPQVQIRIECDPGDTTRVLQLADAILAIAGLRLE